MSGHFSDCDTLTPSEFERFVGAVLEACGWSGVEYTQLNQGGEHGDGGIDIIARRAGRVFGVEVKQRSPENKVGVAELSQLYMGSDLRGIRNKIMITNGYFTSDARRRAFKLGVTLVDRELLRTWWQTNSAELGRAVKPRVYQGMILEELLRRFDAGQKGFFVELATGLGKTYLAAFFVRELLRKDSIQSGRVLFVAHQIELLEQASASFRNVLGVGRYAYSACFDGSELRDTDIVFASFATLYQTLPTLGPDTFDVVVVDEAHHAAAHTYSRVIEHLTPRVLLGLSATPFRSDNKDVLRFFGGKNAVTGRRDVLWAIRHGYLARPRYKVFLDDINPKNLQLIRVGLSIKDLDRTLFLQKKDEEIVRLIGQHIEEVGLSEIRGIIFCKSIRHMRQLVTFFPPGTATLVHSQGMAADTRAANIRAFREGYFKFILVRDLFNEGIDIPETNVLVFLRSTNSRTIWLQQLGRGLRKTESKKDVHVLDFVGSIDRLREVRSFEQRLRNVEVETAELQDPHSDVTLDSELTVQYDERAANVEVLLERFEFELASRAMIVERIEQRIALGEGFPVQSELAETTDSTLNQLATLFGSYAGLAEHILGDETSADLMKHQVSSAAASLKHQLGVEVSVATLQATLKVGDLPFGSDDMVREIQLELFSELQTIEQSTSSENGKPTIHRMRPELVNASSHPRESSSHINQRREELVKHYSSVITTRTDLGKLSRMERELIREHFGNLHALLDLIQRTNGE